MLGIGTPGGHEDFFRDCAELAAEGRFTPETGREVCLRHHIELIGH